MNDPMQAELLTLLGAHKRRILDTARVGLGDAQFEAFRNVVLDELGKSGFEKELEIAFLGQERDGKGRNIHASEGVPE